MADDTAGTPLADTESRPYMLDRCPAACGAQKFLDNASFRITLSRVRSETALRRRAFSFSRSFSRTQP